MSGRLCEYEECGRPSSKKLCPAHDWRRRNGKDMSAPIRDMSGDRERQFWAKVRKSDDCWEWTASVDKKGYGRCAAGLAHRYSYELAHGAIPHGLLLDHMCWNRSCVNPQHLRPVTTHQNQQNRAGANTASKSGIRGVRWRASDHKWRAEVTADGQRYDLGLYATAEEAEATVTAWRREYMPYSLMDQKEK